MYNLISVLGANYGIQDLQGIALRKAIIHVFAADDHCANAYDLVVCFHNAMITERVTAIGYLH